MSEIDNSFRGTKIPTEEDTRMYRERLPDQYEIWDNRMFNMGQQNVQYGTTEISCRQYRLAVMTNVFTINTAMNERAAGLVSGHPIRSPT